MADTKKRVKLYILNSDRQWIDSGTGYVVPACLNNQYYFMVYSETNDNLLLDTKIYPDVAYQKQQDTLIVWCDRTNMELALSFQDKAGCDAVWRIICQAQGRDPTIDIMQDLVIDESDDEALGSIINDDTSELVLPPCSLDKLDEVHKLISCAVTPMQKERMAVILLKENYIEKLLELFRLCEKEDRKGEVKFLCDILKLIISLGKSALLEEMFTEERIFDIVDCLKYQQTCGIKDHREFLEKVVCFKQVIPIKNPKLLEKIHQTYRVQYIQDVILAGASCEENVVSGLISFLFLNKVTIVCLIQEDEEFLPELFSLLANTSVSIEKRRDLIFLLKELCGYSLNLQPAAKHAFFKYLMCLNILSALELSMTVEDQDTKFAATDVLNFLIEFSPSSVREYMLLQTDISARGSMLINTIISEMIYSCDSEQGTPAVQLLAMLKLLLHPENMETAIVKSEKTDFLSYFYKFSIHVIVSPLLANTIKECPYHGEFPKVQLLGIILDFLSFCVEHHSYHIKNFIFHKDLLRHILALMESPHMYLALSALRFMRKIVSLRDEFYNRYIVKGDLFAPVVEALIRNQGRYNLLDSALLEMFEFIRLEDIKSLCVHVVENFGEVLDHITYVETFKRLKMCYEKHNNNNIIIKGNERCLLSPHSDNNETNSVMALNQKASQRCVDGEDENMDFINVDEICEEPTNHKRIISGKTLKNGSMPRLKSIIVDQGTIFTSTDSKELKSFPISKRCHSSMKALVDYENDSSDSEEENEEGHDEEDEEEKRVKVLLSRSCKRPRLT